MPSWKPLTRRVTAVKVNLRCMQLCYLVLRSGFLNTTHTKAIWMKNVYHTSEVVFPSPKTTLSMGYIKLCCTTNLRTWRISSLIQGDWEKRRLFARKLRLTKHPAFLTSISIKKRYIFFSSTWKRISQDHLGKLWLLKIINIS